MSRKNFNNYKVDMIVDFEFNYAKQAFERKMNEKEKVLCKIDEAIAEKGIEIEFLKSKLKENGIPY